MKLATMKNGSRDGRLLVVSRDNHQYTESKTVRTMQQAMDGWDELKGSLQKEYEELSQNPTSGVALNHSDLLAPLPRIYEWIDGSAYINHIVLVRKARGAEPPETLKTSPLVYQGGASVTYAPQQDIRFPTADWGIDFESEIGVILGDTPQGTKAADAHKYIRFVVILNDVSLRGLIPEELKKNFGFFNSKPATAFSPICVAPDELGEAWKDGRLHLKMESTYNGKKFGDPDAGPEMFFSFYDLVEHICKTRSFSAGTVLGSGTVSNEDRSRGSSCLAEKRMIEKIDTGEMTTSFMQHGDTIEIDMKDAHGQSVFGKISQKVVIF